MSTLSQYIGDADIIARFRVRQLRVSVLVRTVVGQQEYEFKSGVILSLFSLRDVIDHVTVRLEIWDYQCVVSFNHHPISYG